MQDKINQSVILSQRLRLAINRSVYNNKELASKTSLSHVTISRYLSGERMPGAEELYRLAKALGVTMNWLMGDDPAKSDEAGQLPGHMLPPPLVERLEQFSKANYIAPEQVLAMALGLFLNSHDAAPSPLAQGPILPPDPRRRTIYDPSAKLPFERTGLAADYIISDRPKEDGRAGDAGQDDKATAQ